jgi:formylglycine-generating enzyme required for sulfatase activity
MTPGQASTVSAVTVTALTDGTTTISATTVDGHKVASCVVTVGGTSVASVNLDKAELGLVGGTTRETSTLSATVGPATAINKQLVWTSSNEAVASISATGMTPGQASSVSAVTVTALTDGTTTISATSVDGHKVASCLVTVGGTSVASVNLDKAQLALTSNTTVLFATVGPATASNRQLKWSSSDPAVASVTASGMTPGAATDVAQVTVSALKDGTATIKAETVDGAKVAQCVVTVTGTSVTGMSIASSTMDMLDGGRDVRALSVSFSPSTALNKGYQVLSSASGMVEVQADQKIKGMASGTATITVRSLDGGIEQTCTVRVLGTRISANIGDLLPVDTGTFNNGTANVTLSSFWMSKFLITQAQYAAVTGRSPSYNVSANGQGTDLNRPVEQVTWYDAVDFCNSLSTLEGLEPVYTITNRNLSSDSQNILGAMVSMDISKSGYRLPTESEWRFAARGGNYTHGYVYAGSNTIDDVAWYRSNSVIGTKYVTHAVGSKAPNELGLYDMTGSVYEWCWDWDGEYVSFAQTDPTGPSSGAYRISPGGSYGNDSNSALISARGSHPPDTVNKNWGFRVVRR